MLPRPLSRRGFTLIEIIVVCLMIGILASFAVTLALDGKAAFIVAKRY